MHRAIFVSNTQHRAHKHHQMPGFQWGWIHRVKRSGTLLNRHPWWHLPCATKIRQTEKWPASSCRPTIKPRDSCRYKNITASLLNICCNTLIQHGVLYCNDRTPDSTANSLDFNQHRFVYSSLHHFSVSEWDTWNCSVVSVCCLCQGKSHTGGVNYGAGVNDWICLSLTQIRHPEEEDGEKNY